MQVRGLAIHRTYALDAGAGHPEGGVALEVEHAHVGGVVRRVGALVSISLYIFTLSGPRIQGHASSVTRMNKWFQEGFKDDGRVARWLVTGAATLSKLPTGSSDGSSPPPTHILPPTMSRFATARRPGRNLVSSPLKMA